MAPIYRPIRVVVTFQDAKGSESSTYTRLLSGTSLDLAGAFAEAYADALELASDAQVTGVQIIAETVYSGYTKPPDSSNVFRTGTLLFTTTNPDERLILEIPSLRLDLLQTIGAYAGIQIDISHATIQALRTAIVDGIGPVAPTGITGNDITGLLLGFLRQP